MIRTPQQEIRALNLRLMFSHKREDCLRSTINILGWLLRRNQLKVMAFGGVMFGLFVVIVLIII